MRDWSRSRAEFNHAWLKNRVLITLGRAKNVLAGTVEDESIWEDLARLLREWQDRRGDAERILAEFPVAASPARELQKPSFSGLDADIKEWLGQLVEQRWKEVEHADSKASRAATALREFDREANNLASVVGGVSCGRGTATEACLTSFQAATKELAEALSALALGVF